MYVGFYFYSDGEDNRSADDSHQKDSLLLTHPKKRGYTTQGHKGEHQGQSGGRRVKGKACARAFTGVFIEEMSNAGYVC